MRIRRPCLFHSGATSLTVAGRPLGPRFHRIVESMNCQEGSSPCGSAATSASSRAGAVAAVAAPSTLRPTLRCQTRHWRLRFQTSPAHQIIQFQLFLGLAAIANLNNDFFITGRCPDIARALQTVIITSAMGRNHQCINDVRCVCSSVCFPRWTSGASRP